MSVPNGVYILVEVSFLFKEEARGVRGKSLLNENAIIILGFNQSIEESVC